jgi:hypothetical protein
VEVVLVVDLDGDGDLNVLASGVDGPSTSVEQVHVAVAVKVHDYV